MIEWQRMLRVRLVHWFAALIGVPIKVRERFWFPDELTTIRESGARDGQA
jgi:hypothetical protein